MKRQLVADVPIGILLSGGIDSSLVTALAARASARPVKTFTISFPGYGNYDEAPYARLVAEYFGTEHTELVAEPSTVDLLPELARQYDEPMADSSIIPTFLVSRLIRQHASVALSGDGGEELFGGYVYYSRFLDQERVHRWMPKTASRLARFAVGHMLPVGLPGRGNVMQLASSGPSALPTPTCLMSCIGGGSWYRYREHGQIRIVWLKRTRGGCAIGITRCCSRRLVSTSLRICPMIFWLRLIELVC